MSARCYWLLAIALPSLAFGDGFSTAPESVEVTIYRAQPGLTSDIVKMDAEARGLAMITETRTIDIPSGTSTISFRGVAETIVPQSAKLESLPAQIVETNFDYSLIGPGELIANSIGKTVRVIRTDQKTGRSTEQRATLVSGPEGVLLNIDGRIEALNCSGVSEKIVFDEIPPSLAAQPTLSATVRSTQAGRYRVRLSYLALGLDWSADYVARIHPDGRKLDLSGWITLANKQSTGFNDAKVQVVAGNISVMQEETVPQEVTAKLFENKCWPVGSFITYYDSRLKKSELAAAPMIMMRGMAAKQEEIIVTAQKRMAEQSELGDYKLYSLPVASTVAARQIKQVQMLDRSNVPFARIYTYEVPAYPFDSESVAMRPTTTLRLQNKKSDGLGLPLPAGTASVMEASAQHGLVLAGEHSLLDVPVGLPLDIELGEAMDIWTRPRVVRESRQWRVDHNAVQTEIEIEIANDKPANIQLELYQQRVGADDLRIVTESARHTLKKGMFMWSVSLKSQERKTLRYTVEHATSAAGEF